MVVKKITAHRQYHPEYPKWVAIAKWQGADKIMMMNAEGNTEEEAINRLKSKIKKS